MLLTAVVTLHLICCWQCYRTDFKKPRRSSLLSPKQLSKHQRRCCGSSDVLRTRCLTAPLLPSAPHLRFVLSFLFPDALYFFSLSGFANRMVILFSSEGNSAVMYCCYFNTFFLCDSSPQITSIMIMPRILTSDKLGKPGAFRKNPIGLQVLLSISPKVCCR